jgi:iron complex transport system ATP-binding protein
MPAMKSLKTQGLTCNYGTLRVLDELSVAARAGEVLALVGPNGAGKTTLLRALARLLRPAHGSVALCERNIWLMRAGEYARQVALAPQSEKRDWPLTVEEAVRLGRAPHRGWLLPLADDDLQVVMQALARTGLVELRQRPITELSGGEWRRMILARALAQQASVLLFDEPTAGLDMKYQVEVLRLVRELTVREKLVAVMSLHDLNQASICADRLAVLNVGKLVALGSPADVLTAELISRTFGVSVTVTRHPVHGVPLVLPTFDTVL